MATVRSKIEDHYRARTPRSAALFQRALELLPGGVTHSNRFWPPYPLYIDRVSGSRMWDVDANEYIDYWLANGTMFVGHAHPQVEAAVADQLKRGSHFGLSNEPMLKLAAKVIELVPCAEMVRFANSGTEAIAHSFRIARGYTGRTKIARFEGTFHGVHDEIYVAVRAPFAGPDCAGIPPSAYADILVCPFNDLAGTTAILTKHRHDLAGIVIEPVSGSIPASRGFLQGLRDLTTDLGAVLIYDEIVTGFRLAPGGAQQMYGIIPDLAALGKVLGGGFPIGVVAGRREVMEVLLPSRPRDQRVDIFGTYSGSPAVMTAGLETLKLLEDGRAQRHASALGARMQEGLSEILARRGEKAVVGCVECIVQVFFGLERLPQNHREEEEGDRAMRRRFHLALMNRGVFFKYGTEGRISAAHTERDIDQTLAQMDAVIGEGLHRA